MDPLAHTLVGATLAQTRLRDWTPLAAPALILGANAPDIDAIAMFVQGDFALGFRRGWTHGVLAMLVLPLALAGLLTVAARLSGRSVRAVPLLALCAIAIWSHPLLDWLNNYGIRLLMPFDGRWFYGDALFIVDPWLWLMAAAPLVLTQARSWPSLAVWLVLGASTSALVLRAPFVPPTAQGIWIGGVALLIVLRAWDRLAPHSTKVATTALALLCLYIAAMRTGTVLAKHEVEAWLEARGIAPVDVMAGPVPADPFARQIVAADGDRYHLLDLRFGREPLLRTRAPALDVGPRNGPIVAAAIRAEHVRGLVTWMRFPSFRVEPRGSGYRVYLQDARRAARSTFGQAFVDLDTNLEVIPPDPPTNPRTR